MINRLIFCTLLAGAALTARADKVVEFYFLDPYSIGGSPKTLVEYMETAPASIYKPSGNNWVLLLTDGTSTQSLVKEGVALTAKTPGTKPRIHFQGTAYDDTKDIFLSDFRCYAGNKISLEAPAGYTITKVVMHGKASTPGNANCCDNIKVDAACGGTQTQDGGTNTWSIAGNGIPKVTYTAATGCETQAVYRMWVYLKGDGSGVDAVAADADTADVEYYDFMGVRVDPANLGSGMYIRRQGVRSDKILVR